MKKAVLILIFISTTFWLFAATPDSRTREVFSRANKAYEQGKYEEAVDRYLKLLPVVGDNSVLFFNLGNAYYKSGELGEAVLYYRKAARLSPRDEDIKQNLEIARLHIKDKIVQPDPGFVFKVIAGLHNFFSIDELTVVTLAFYLLLCAVIIYRIYAKNLSTSGPTNETGYLSGLITFLIIILVFPTISLAVKIYAKEFLDQGVVISREAEVYSGPGTNYQHTFTLHEGTDLSIERDRKDWYEVKVGVNLKGWMKKTAIGKL